MGWLLGYSLGSMAAAFVVVRVFDYLVSGAVDTSTNAARSIVFGTTWAGVTAFTGMRDVSKVSQRLRAKSKIATDKLDAIVGDKTKR